MYPGSSVGPSPEPETQKEEEIQLLEFPLEFEEELFKDFRNTSNYPHQRKPPVPNTPKKRYIFRNSPNYPQITLNQV